MEADVATRSEHGKANYRVLNRNDCANTVCAVSPFRGEGQGFRPEMLQATVDGVANTGVDAQFLQPVDVDPPYGNSKICHGWNPASPPADVVVTLEPN